jgi:hypothetical protein
MVVPVCVSKNVDVKLLDEAQATLLLQRSVPSVAVVQDTFGICWISLQLGPKQLKDMEKGCSTPQKTYPAVTTVDMMQSDMRLLRQCSCECKAIGGIPFDSQGGEKQATLMRA